MRTLDIKIQLEDNESKKDILTLLLETMSETNDKGYPITHAFVDGVEVFGDKGLSKEFFG